MWLLVVHKRQDRLRAACSGRSGIFDDPEREAEALAICAACPVLSQCHGWSLHNAVEGVAGGMTSKTRKAWRKARKIAGPVVSINDYLTREVVARDHVGKHRWPDTALMAIAAWTSEGESAEDIADRLGITRRAVVRYRNVCRARALIA